MVSANQLNELKTRAVKICCCSYDFTRAYLFQIALEIIWLPILINQRKT